MAGGERRESEYKEAKKPKGSKSQKGHRDNVVKMCCIRIEELVGDEDSVCGHKSRTLKPPII